MTSILLVAPMPIGQQRTGPAIRFLELARVLSVEHQVTLLLPDGRPTQSPDFRSCCRGDTSMEAELETHEVVLVQGPAFQIHPELARLLVEGFHYLVVDIYDPITLELLGGDTENQIGRLRRSEYAALLNEQLRLGDFFICASERQRDYWLGALSALGRINHDTDDGADLRNLIDVVPFGIPSISPTSTGPVLRGVHPQIAPNDRLIIWGGGLWDWLDPLTPVKAMQEVAGQHPGARLVFFESPEHRSAMFREVKRVADELGLLGRHVVFSDWLPADRWGDCLLEADVGLSYHPANIETRFAFRTRLLDYIWAGLPVVTAAGDVLSALVETHDLGRVVNPGSQSQLAEALIGLLDEPNPRARRSEGFQRAAKELVWEKTAGPLTAYCRRPWHAGDRTGDLAMRWTAAQRDRRASEIARMERQRLEALQRPADRGTDDSVQTSVLAVDQQQTVPSSAANLTRGAAPVPGVGVGDGCFPPPATVRGRPATTYGHASRRHVLVVSHDRVHSRMAGPGIRYRELARVLAEHFRVTLAAPGETDLPGARFSVKPYERGDWNSLAEAADNADVILLCGDTLADFPSLVSQRASLVVDGYDPHTVETLALWAEEDPAVQMARHAERREILRLQCQCGDFFVCASERQRDWWLGVLEQEGRLSPLSYAGDPSLRRLVDVVPFGLPAQPPRAMHSVLREHWEGIGSEDLVLLWGGGLWEWLDPLTAVRAVNRLVESDAIGERIRLVFPGTRHPNPAVPEMVMAERTISLADRLGLTGKHVFFGEWLPYEDWPGALLEADVGLSLHPDTVESRLAYRSRILDYTWAGLPMVVTRGDVLSEVVERYGLGYVVDYGDEAGVAEAIRALGGQPRSDRSEAFLQAQQQMTWERAAQPLVEFCRHPRRTAERGSAPGPTYSRESQEQEHALAECRKEILRLETLVAGYERGRFIRMMRRLHQWRERARGL